MICLLFCLWLIAILALDVADACRQPLDQPQPRRSAPPLNWEG